MNRLFNELVREAELQVQLGKQQSHNVLMSESLQEFSRTWFQEFEQTQNVAAFLQETLSTTTHSEYYWQKKAKRLQNEVARPEGRQLAEGNFSNASMSKGKSENLLWLSP